MVGLNLRSPDPEKFDEDEFRLAYFFLEHYVHECPTVTEVTNYIGAKTTHNNARDFFSDEKAKTFRLPGTRPVQSVIIDYSVPFGGKGGLFEQVLSGLSTPFSEIKLLQGHVALMISLLIATKCPNIRELIVYLPLGTLSTEPWFLP